MSKKRQTDATPEQPGPLKCSICGKEFKNQQGLGGHMRYTHKQVSAKTCETLRGVLSLQLAKLNRMADPAFRNVMAQAKEQEIKLRLGMLCVAVQQLQIMASLIDLTERMSKIAQETFDSPKTQKALRKLPYEEQLKILDTHHRVMAAGFDLIFKIMSLKVPQDDLVEQINQLAMEYRSYMQGEKEESKPDQPALLPGCIDIKLNPQEREQLRRLTDALLAGKITPEEVMAAGEEGDDEPDGHTDEGSEAGKTGC